MVPDSPDIGKPYFTVKVYESFADHDTVFNWYRITVEGTTSKQDLSAQDKHDTDIKSKNDQIAQMQQAINYLKVEVGRLEGEVFFWKSRANSFQYP